MPINYYQVYKTLASEDVLMEHDNLVYEDDNCKISYDFWAEGGNFGFRFFNKSDKNIYIDLEKTFLIRNGIANNYYKGRSYTEASGIGLVATYTTSREEESVICVPYNSSKIIYEYSINEDLIRDCYLLKYPSRKQVSKLYYSKDDSPLVFSNRIAYRLDGEEPVQTFENEFYISEVSNVPESEMFISDFLRFCEQESMIMKQYFKTTSPDMFYIKYSKGDDQWKH